MHDALPATPLPASAIPLKVLLAEDSPTARKLIAAILEELGHEVFAVENGLRAVQEFERGRFDLALLDIVMPVMDGFEAARQIKRLAAAWNEWVPVLLMSGIERQSCIVEGLAAGADDFIPKPWLMEILGVKVEGFAKTILADRQLRASEAEARATVARLAELNAQTERELEMAHRIMERLMPKEQLADPQAAHFLIPSSRFSGDAIALSRSPDGVLYAMLADATGHGLTAAMSVLPALWVFDGMARKQAALPDIAAEINRRLKEMLPTGNFVAAHLLSVDNAARTLRLWSGGMPPALLLDRAAMSVQSLKSDHVALGILPNGAFDASCKTLEWDSPQECLLYSDGLPEAQSEGGCMLGDERLMQAVMDLGAETAVATLARLAGEHLAGRPALDDISVLSLLLGAFAPQA
jgi:CheY-like chemotaxis protein